MADYSHLMGWKDDQREVDKIIASMQNPYMGMVAQAICGSGQGKVQLLYPYVEKLHGQYPVLFQAIGDCVSMGTAGAVTVLTAVEIMMHNEYEEWQGITSTEDIYGGSRVQIGKGQLGNGDGSIGAWAAQYCKQYGTLVRKKYDSIDLTTYSGQRAKEWGAPRRGTPAILLPYAREHRVNTVTLVKTYEEVRDAIYNGYPVTICSNRGFSSQRDNEGFARPQGSWPHCMLIHAVDDAYKRPGVCIQNSWGPSWISGPKRHNQPDGSFWCDADVLERDILRGQDSWAFSSFEGYPKQDINWNIISQIADKFKDFDGVVK